MKPSVNVCGLNLVRSRIKNGGILELSADHIQSRLFKVCAAPKHQANALFLLAETDGRITIQKPYGVPVPNLKICFRKAGEDIVRKLATDFVVVCSKALYMRSQCRRKVQGHVEV